MDSPTREASATHRRDAQATTAALLAAGRRLFARQGYAASSVREIAAAAGVNVALINRYFGSKAGLFAACLHEASSGLPTSASIANARDMAQVMTRAVLGSSNDGRPSDDLLLLIRSSGDAATEKVRVDVLRSFTERIAVASGRPDAGTAQALLNAQVVLAMLHGIGLLRSTTQLAPLSGVSEHDLSQVIETVITTLLAPGSSSTA